MRTTLDIEADVLKAAKEIAAREHTTTGRVLSRLARRGLSPGSKPGSTMRNGIEMLPARGEPVTLDQVQALMDEEGI
ncbi:hypothetical protein [Coraliomargarita parva]|uniref:hypothetical protein n=1 Tax=Coraliomargarita parva TaxID=3014050 RepID=UPI0022B4197D|nr:hypothetical protein [Coraliomargarita parva]